MRSSIAEYSQHRLGFQQKHHQGWILQLIPSQAKFFQDLGLEIFAGANIGGSFCARTAEFNDIWLDLSDAFAIAEACQIQAEQALELILLHEAGHLLGDGELEAWENAVKLWAKLPERLASPMDLANAASFCVTSHRLGRPPLFGEWAKAR